MKRVAFILLMTTCFGVYTQAQHVESNKQINGNTLEKIIYDEVQLLDDSLILDSSQKLNVKIICETYLAGVSNITANNNSQEEKLLAMKRMEAEKLKKLKNVLNKEQFEKYVELIERSKKHFQNRKRAFN